MREDIEKRLHRVAITLDKDNLKCPYSKQCDKAKYCKRCNVFFEKCTLFKDLNLSI